jgi:type III secretion protein J
VRSDPPYLLLPALGLLLLLGACSKPMTKVYGDQTERDANEMVLILRRHNIEAMKVPEKTGVNIMVPEPEFMEAVAVLEGAGLPRKKHATVVDLFPSGSMFSSPAELEIRSRYSLEQQISSYLTMIPGVRTAQVILSIPQAPPRGATPPSSASVLLVLSDRFESDGLLARVRQFVRNSVPNLALDNITVSVFRGPVDASQTTQAEASRGG